MTNLEAAVRAFLEEKVAPPEHFHTVERHHPLCTGRIEEDRSRCDCRPTIEVHGGRHVDCAACQLVRH
jgi:hypothetical protein